MDIKDLKKVNDYLTNKGIAPLTVEQHAALTTHGVFPRVFPLDVMKVPDKRLNDITEQEWLDIAAADYSLEEFAQMCNEGRFELTDYFFRFI